MLPEDPQYVSFDLGPIRPRDVRQVLKGTNKKSSPGPDGITYGILHHLPCTDQILATHFNKVLISGVPPPSWSESLIKLIHKKGLNEDPTNFRMIALTSTIGKTYHLILAKRTTDYLLINGLIDPEVQKAFLPGINGCIEHNVVLEEVIKDARINKKTLHITFFDLADAFGSVPGYTII